MPAEARPRAAGFSLIEVVFCMAIFAIGFLAVAIMLPSGVVMQKELQNRTDASIIGKNALEILKAKGIQNLSNEWVTHLGGNGGYDNQAWWTLAGVAGANTINPLHAAAISFPGNMASRFKDMEIVSDANLHPPSPTQSASYQLTGYWRAPYRIGSLCAAVSHMPSCTAYWDTNKNGGDIGGYDHWNFGYSLHYSAGMLSSAGGYYNGWTGPYSLTDDWRTDGIGDHTRWGYGRIHVYKNRPIPGVTPNYFSTIDFSYPASVFDMSQRQYFSYPQLVNRSTTPQGSDSCVVATTNDWHILALTTSRPAELETSAGGAKGWPEAVESDLSLPDQFASPAPPINKMLHRPTIYDQHPDWGGGYHPANEMGPHWKLSNNGVDFLSLSSRPLPVPKGYGAAPLRPYGGMPDNGNLAWQGWCGRFNSRTFYYDGPTMAKRMWDYHTVGCNYFYGPTTKDADGNYVVPVPMDVLAIVYDKASNLLLLRYPQCFAKTPEPGNPRLSSAVFPTGSSWVDRRLKVGDQLVTLSGGYALRVKAVLDEAAAAAALPAARLGGRSGPPDWSDGTYQVVQVTPSLDGTNISDNAPVGNAINGNLEAGINPWYANWEINSPNGWSLYRVVIGTPPVTGGPNSLAAVNELPGSGTTAGGVIRINDNLTE